MRAILYKCWIFLLVNICFPLTLFTQVILEEFVFDNAPFPSCHASTIVETENGLITAWFGGTHEKHHDVGIWISRKIDNQWTEPLEIANGIQHVDKRYPCWNPVLYRNPDGRISLYYKVGPSPSEWWGMVMESSDEGQTWSIPHRLPEDILGPIKNKPVLLHNGTLICPSSSENNGWKVHLELTKDLGKSWQIIGPLEGIDIEAIQPTVLQHGDRLQILCRSKKSGVVQSWSEDHGSTWSPLEKSLLPNPNSGIDGVTTAEGQHYLVYNPTSVPEGKWGGDRYPLVLAKSDDGTNWKVLVTLEQEPGEYSYPAIIETRDHNLHITYTWNRNNIKHMVFKP